MRIMVSNSRRVNPDPERRTTEIVGFDRDITPRGEPDFMATFNLAALGQGVALGLLRQKEFRIGVNPALW